MTLAFRPTGASQLVPFTDGSSISSAQFAYADSSLVTAVMFHNADANAVCVNASYDSNVEARFPTGGSPGQGIVCPAGQNVVVIIGPGPVPGTTGWDGGIFLNAEGISVSGNVFATPGTLS